MKQGIKTGLAGTITYAIYAGWNLPQGYWAVFAALVVTQANVGASWKAALYRTIGTVQGFSDLADALRARSKEVQSGESLEQAVRDLDSDLAHLRKERTTAPFSLDRMLPFCSFVFNLREAAQDLRQLSASVGELA
ncbi:MAG: FUSC family protein [Candidatus Sulfotelmatobacter sp.]